MVHATNGFNTPPTGPAEAGLIGLADFGARLTAAMDIRMAAAHTTLTKVCADLRINERKMRYWRAGENEAPFSQILRLQSYFTALGCPGLIADIEAAAGWRSERLPLAAGTGLDGLPETARCLIESLPDLRAAVSVEDLLAERGLLPFVHIMLRDEADRVFMIHRGGKMTSAAQIDRTIFGRDIRLLAPQGYGIEVYPQVMDCLCRDEPAHHHISSPEADYYRIAVPVGAFYVAYSYRITCSPHFMLR